MRHAARNRRLMQSKMGWRDRRVSTRRTILLINSNIGLWLCHTRVLDCCLDLGASSVSRHADNHQSFAVESEELH